jgi:hypothetical protein
LPEGAAREHDRLRAGELPRVGDPPRLVHAAREDHRGVQALDELAGELEVRIALVVDLRAARVEGDAGDAGLGDEPVGELDARGVALLLARAQLDGDRQARALAAAFATRPAVSCVLEHRGRRRRSW